MDRNDFLRKALTTFLVPTKTAYNVPVGEAKHILENLVGIYIARDELIDLMTAEGFVYRETGVCSGHFRANYRIHPAMLLNQQWSQDYIRVHFGRKNFEKWDSINDAIVVLKHMFANSHGRHNESVDNVVQDILVRGVNADIPDTDPAPIGIENPN